MDSIFKQTLRAELDFQGIKVKELASHTGISPRTIEGYLSSRASIPPADVAFKIARALGVTVEYLITGEERDPGLPLNMRCFEVVTKFMELDEEKKCAVENVIDLFLEG